MKNVFASDADRGLAPSNVFAADGCGFNDAKGKQDRGHVFTYRNASRAVGGIRTNISAADREGTVFLVILVVALSIAECGLTPWL